MEGVMQVWLAAEVQLLSVSGFPSDIPIAANPLHRGSAWTWTFHQGLAIAGRAVEQADLRCRLVT